MFLFFRELLYEVSESTADVIPFSLYRVLSKWSRRKDEDEVYLFLSVLYVMMLECGFSPVCLAAYELDEDTPWVQKEANFKNINYDINRIQYYTANFEPFLFENPYMWKFEVKNLKSLRLTFVIDLIIFGREDLFVQGSDILLNVNGKLHIFFNTPFLLLM